MATVAAGPGSVHGALLTGAVLQSAREWRLIASVLESAQELCRLGRVDDCVNALHSLHVVALLQAGRLEQAAGGGRARAAEAAPGIAEGGLRG